METLTKEIEIKIGVVTYYFDCTFYYYEGNNSIDPTEREEWQFKDFEIESEIQAVTDQGFEYFVRDTAEREQVLNHFFPELDLAYYLQ